MAIKRNSLVRYLAGMLGVVLLVFGVVILVAGDITSVAVLLAAAYFINYAATGSERLFAHRREPKHK